MKLDDKEREITRKVANRAIRRLSFLEYLVLLVALVLALAGGALVAWLLNASLGFSFRWGWVLGSLLLFVIPGGFVYLRELRRTHHSSRGSTGIAPSHLPSGGEEARGRRPRGGKDVKPKNARSERGGKPKPKEGHG